MPLCEDVTSPVHSSGCSELSRSRIIARWCGVGKTEAAGQRLEEAKAINKSLSALGDVIGALAAKKGKKGGHVPFRNSKLTFLLQDSLSGDSKVMMFVNSSPVLWNAPETVCSLNFAKRCRSVQLGAATRHSSNPEVVRLSREVAALRKELSERRAREQTAAKMKAAQRAKSGP